MPFTKCCCQCCSMLQWKLYCWPSCHHLLLTLSPANHGLVLIAPALPLILMQLHLLLFDCSDLACILVLLILLLSFFVCSFFLLFLLVCFSSVPASFLNRCQSDVNVVKTVCWVCVDKLPDHCIFLSCTGGGMACVEMYFN
jgi:hypothetical protein